MSSGGSSGSQPVRSFGDYKLDADSIVSTKIQRCLPNHAVARDALVLAEYLSQMRAFAAPLHGTERSSAHVLPSLASGSFGALASVRSNDSFGPYRTSR